MKRCSLVLPNGDVFEGRLSANGTRCGMGRLQLRYGEFVLQGVHAFCVYAFISSLTLSPPHHSLSLTHIRDGGTLSGCWNGPDSIAGPALMTDADGATTEASEGWSAAGGFAGAIVERHVHQLASNLSQQPSVQLSNTKDCVRA